MPENKLIIDVIIPAFNEESSIGHVLNDIPEGLVREVCVCNNGSTDATSEIAMARGATVLEQPEMGYGNACLKGLGYIAEKGIITKPNIPQNILSSNSTSLEYQ